MSFAGSEKVDQIRARIDHPIVDGDGHLLEYMPLVRDFIVEEAGEAVGRGFDRLVHHSELSRQVPLEQRRALGIARTGWWSVPTQNTLDRATAMLPELMYRRLDELGIDYALLYPTHGLFATTIPDQELRLTMARAFNRSYAELYAPFRDRLEPVAVIPTVTPSEAVAELDHAVGELGLKAVTLSGVVRRAVPGAEATPGAYYLDSIAHDSIHDYDPLWRRCVELGVSPTFHGSTQGTATHGSRTNYVHNHIGSFAAAQEAACRGLLFGGVPARFPELHFSFLEGGVAWAVNLYSDILGHWEKRNGKAVRRYDPAKLDRGQLEELCQKYGPSALIDRLDRLDEALLPLSDPAEEPGAIDEFADSGISGPDDVGALFAERFYFGCEADDPMNALAFNTSFIPGQARLRPLFASDVGHWDVPDMREVLPEAWEMVEHGHLSEADFRDFTFANSVSLWGSTNPSFFDGTAVADAARKQLAGR